jgi:zinc transporter 2
MKNNIHKHNHSSDVAIKLNVKESSSVNKKTDQDEALRKMIIISIICTLFLISELIGGVIANSLAILTDAAHLCSDLSGFIISIIAIYIGKKKPNKTYTFGYYRAEVLGALISVITIWILTGLLLKEAYDRLITPSEIKAGVMLLIAVLGLICNLAMMKVLHSGHEHGGGCSHGHAGHSHNHDEHDLESHINLEEEELDQTHIELEDNSINDIDTERNSSRSRDIFSENSIEVEEENNHQHEHNEHGKCDHSHSHNGEDEENKKTPKNKEKNKHKENHTKCDHSHSENHTTESHIHTHSSEIHSHSNESSHTHTHEGKFFNFFLFILYRKCKYKSCVHSYHWRHHSKCWSCYRLTYNLF